MSFYDRRLMLYILSIQNSRTRLEFSVVMQTRHSWNSAGDTKADRTEAVFHSMEWETECAGTRLGAVTGNPQNQAQRGSPSLTAALWGVDILSSLLLLSLCLSVACSVVFRKICYAAIWHMAWDIKVEREDRGWKEVRERNGGTSPLLTYWSIWAIRRKGDSQRSKTDEKHDRNAEQTKKNHILRQKLFKGIIIWMWRKKVNWQIRNECGVGSGEKTRWRVISMLVNRYISRSSFAELFTAADLLSCKPCSRKTGNTVL